MAVVVVSDQLPVTLRPCEDGYTLLESHGGVAAGLRTV